jgi:hypothetical protein
VYIEFTLPSGVHGATAASALYALQRETASWSEKYNVPVTTKVIKYKFRISFNDDRSYSLFALTWQPRSQHSFWTDYRIITDLNNKL